nr:hypothetical protein [Streptomyces sp. DSM 41633]
MPDAETAGGNTDDELCSVPGGVAQSHDPARRRQRMRHPHVVGVGGQRVDQLVVPHHRDQPRVWLGVDQA